MWEVLHGGCVNAAMDSVLPNDGCQGSSSGLAVTAELLHVQMPWPSQVAQCMYVC